MELYEQAAGRNDSCRPSQRGDLDIVPLIFGLAQAQQGLARSETASLKRSMAQWPQQHDIPTASSEGKSSRAMRVHRML